jgi:glycyl-tRNA synthetase beta chain
MPDFLLEIGTEEIPARMIDDARSELVRRMAALLARESLMKPAEGRPVEDESSWTAFTSYSTPRRLAFRVAGIPTHQPDVTEQVTGPSVKVAFKDGKPTPAADAFARKVGVDVGQLEKVTNPKGEYLAATVTRKGRHAADILAEAVPKEIAAIYWPKNMYWRAGKPERFVRPVRWLVAMFGDQVVPMELAGLKAGAQTYGHRILGPGARAIARPEQYEEALKEARVLVHSGDREHKIRKALDAATRTVAGARWREDPELLKTVVNLTEWPSAILGNFDQQFLSLPEEVLVTVMRDHQKYFAAEDSSGKLAPHFLAVLNTDGDPDGLIRHGNERVLRARFNDARFFWDTDQKVALKDRVEMLRAVTFQKDLGSYFDKAERIVNLGDRLCRVVDAAGLRVEPSAIQQAARYAKTDLTTELVKEFTELQGIIGGLYAKAQGLPQGVADAIYDQYKPESTEDSAPRTLEGAVLSIADKADSIAGMFALGLVPSGSKDPFALRRQANGIVKILVEHKLPLNLSLLLADARKQYAGSEAEKKFAQNDEAYTESIRGFFRERLEFYLRDVLGLAYDVVNATLAAGADDVVDAVARANAISEVRSSAYFESISVAFKRIKNILSQALERKYRIETGGLAELLQSKEAEELLLAANAIGPEFKKFRMSKDYVAALQVMSTLRNPIDRFFDSVMVMVEDEETRAHRLGLVQEFVRNFSTIADFSEIVTEKKAPTKG